MKAIVFLSFVILLFALILPAGRAAFGWILATPGGRLLAWIVLTVRFLVDSHVCVVRNLILPRKVIFPTLEKDKSTNQS